MLVKLKLRHEISRRDAQEGARTERECIRGEVVPGPNTIDEEEQQNAQRNDQREEEIHQQDACSRRSADTHHRRDGEGIERLVEQDGEKRSKTCKAHQDRTGFGGRVISLQFVIHGDGRPQGDACKERVNGHSEECSNPAHGVVTVWSAFVAVMAPMAFMAVIGGVARLVMMEAEEAFQKEDQEKTAQKGHDDT